METGNDSGVNASVASLGSELNSAVVHGLRPSQAYFCSVRAENEIGLSESSDHVEVFTKQEGNLINLTIFKFNFLFDLGSRLVPLYRSD